MASPTPIESSHLSAVAGSGATHGASDMSFFTMIMNADIIVQFVMLLLIVSSIWSWTIIFDKYMRFRSLKDKTSKFEKVFWSGQPLENLYERVKTFADNPFAMVFVAAMEEWKRNSQPIQQDSTLRSGVKERIFRAMQVATNRSLERVEKRLTFLATVGSSATFVGLFGTVGGIMNSLKSIAVANNTSLATVAPGIAEALFATAVGLFAAIPAVVFYNMFSNELNKFIIRLENFTHELGSLLSRDIDQNR